MHHLSVPFSYLIINADFKVRSSGLGVVVFTPHKGEDGGEEAGHHFEGGQVSASSLRGAARWGQVRASQDGRGGDWCGVEGTGTVWYGLKEGKRNRNRRVSTDKEEK